MSYVYESVNEFKDNFVNCSVYTQCHNSGFNIYAHWHERFEILHIINGSLKLVCDSECFTARSGDTVFINPSEIHSGVFCEDNTLIVVCDFTLEQLISKSEDYCDDILKSILSGNKRIAHLFCGDNVLNECITHLHEISMAEVHNEFRLKACLFNVLARTFELSELKQEEKMGSLSTQFSKVFQYIIDNYGENITLKDMADYIGYTENYFCRWFKNAVGETPFNYLSIVRLQNAKRLLVTTDLSLIDIAVSCGFNSANYLSRKFKEYFGVSPSFMRKSEKDNVLV